MFSFPLIDVSKLRVFLWEKTEMKLEFYNLIYLNDTYAKTTMDKFA